MAYLSGYILASLLSFFLAMIVVSSCHKKSSIKPSLRFFPQPPKVSTRTIISISLLLPMAAFSFLLLVFPSAVLTQSLISQGHRAFVLGGLLVPAVCFMSGYFYFKKVLRF